PGSRTRAEWPASGRSWVDSSMRSPSRRCARNAAGQRRASVMREGLARLIPEGNRRDAFRLRCWRPWCAGYLGTLSSWDGLVLPAGYARGTGGIYAYAPPPPMSPAFKFGERFDAELLPEPVRIEFSNLPQRVQCPRGPHCRAVTIVTRDAVAGLDIFEDRARR